ncbi:MAG: Phosphoribosylformylglycinamidine cyclo-ligase [Chloroflexi bacterium ADurb.Bin325]|nr:MAG: Phosphoribosylformylglycinamidine cyclo-ligase [Chloroflexi bacterium ADurb.Bin325]
MMAETPGISYRDAGVDIAAGTRAVALMRDAVRSTYGPEVLLGIGAFGGLYDAGALKGLAEPVLVASTDGVGTKVKIASALGRFDTIGHDIVNHCVNDILVQGARPLFFLDYIAAERLDPVMAAAVEVAELGCTLGDALLAPHRSYLTAVNTLQAAGIQIRGMAHITGGGLIDNPPRIFPPGLAARLYRDRWPAPPIFDLIQRSGRIADAEMAHVFNLGLGMLLILPAGQSAEALALLGEDAWNVGEMIARDAGPTVEIVR